MPSDGMALDAPARDKPEVPTVQVCLSVRTSSAKRQLGRRNGRPRQEIQGFE